MRLQDEAPAKHFARNVRELQENLNMLKAGRNVHG